VRCYQQGFDDWIQRVFRQGAPWGRRRPFPALAIAFSVAVVPLVGSGAAGIPKTLNPQRTIVAFITDRGGMLMGETPEETAPQLRSRGTHQVKSKIKSKILDFAAGVAGDRYPSHQPAEVPQVLAEALGTSARSRSRTGL
jgi:hypothetical protein